MKYPNPNKHDTLQISREDYEELVQTIVTLQAKIIELQNEMNDLQGGSSSGSRSHTTVRPPVILDFSRAAKRDEILEYRLEDIAYFEAIGRGDVNKEIGKLVKERKARIVKPDGTYMNLTVEDSGS